MRIRVYIREAQNKASGDDAYVISFASLVLLYELGVPLDVIKSKNAWSNSLDNVIRNIVKDLIK